MIADGACPLRHPASLAPDLPSVLALCLAARSACWQDPAQLCTALPALPPRQAAAKFNDAYVIILKLFGCALLFFLAELLKVGSV